ncbi:MAG: sodium:proton antiporter [Actinomycetota bacterium]|nr:sodium:proton antiporter [Actinomycetota bacterium]
MELLIVVVAGLLAVAGAAAIAPRLRIAAPLILVVMGIGISVLPFVPDIEIDPEWILAGVLPPLLYSAAVAMPAMNFRREFTAIRGLAVALVVLSAVVLGVFFSWAIPGLSIWWGIALGAIVSPTDAVATSIVRSVGVSGRVSSVLAGESLLNDATALVLLRSAIAGTAATMTLRHIALDFAWAVAVALVLGLVVGRLNLWVRAKVADSTVNTIISFTVPFLASIPAELLGASGLVAAVVAGLVTGHGAPRVLPPRHRQSDTQNWHTVELVLEGAIFLVMGLELSAIVGDVNDQHVGLGTAFVVALAALALVLVVRAAYVAPLLAGLARGARRRTQRTTVTSDPRHRRSLADIDYLLAAPLGWRDGAVLVWAGMRGAVTLAAAQTLPSDAPERSLLVLIAFVVAASSLLIQGGTLGAFVRWIRPTEPTPDPGRTEELTAILVRVRDDLIASTDPDERVPVEPPEIVAGHVTLPPTLSLRVLDAQRDALLDARDDGLFDAELLEAALERLDAAQISVELRGP